MYSDSYGRPLTLYDICGKRYGLVKILTNMWMMAPCGVVTAPCGVVMAPCGVVMAPCGVVMAPCGVVMAPRGVMMAPRGAIMTPHGGTTCCSIGAVVSSPDKHVVLWPG